MKSLKVNQIEKARLSNTEMAYVTGGESCGCACLYADSGGSSTASNKNANAASGLHSPGMLHITGYMNEDGSWTLCDKWVLIAK